MVAYSLEVVSKETYNTSFQDDAFGATGISSCCTSTPAEAQTSGMQDIRQRLTDQGFSEAASHLILNSWRPSTTKLYDRFIAKWKSYAFIHNVNVLNPDICHVANFLAELFREGLS